MIRKSVKCVIYYFSVLHIFTPGTCSEAYGTVVSMKLLALFPLGPGVGGVYALSDMLSGLSFVCLKALSLDAEE